LPFGGYHWRILDIQGNAALILTEYMIEQHSYITDNEKNTVSGSMKLILSIKRQNK
jgi:hypothetical protein